jgi:hypothetical protein
MNLTGSTIGAIAAVAAYTLLLVAYFTTIIKKYPNDRGIRFGIITVIVAVCTVAIFRVPELQGILNWILPLLFVTELVLVCVTLFFLVEESVIDIRKWCKKKRER